MIVKYAGETALQPDGSGELASFIKRYIPLDGLRDQSPAIASSGNRSGGIGQTGVNLAQPNYPRDPEVKINQLFWPTGAARWSRGYFLFHASQITSILSSSSNGISSQTLTLTDGTTTISPSMYHLPPRKLSAVSGSDNIYLLPVVDERYYWQFSDSGSTGISDSDNWAALFSYLQGELGGTITLTSAASADYFEPDYIEFSRLHENIATIIDAACHSIGHRFVYGLDNSRKSMDVTTAGTTLTSNVASYTRIAGGSLDSPPETGIAVIFPVADGGAPSGGWHDEVSAGSGVTSTQVVRTTALAEQDDSNTSLINNTSDLSTLASKVTSDLRSWQSKSYDHAFVDLHDWEMCGHDDHLLFSASHQVQSTSLARETDSGTKVVDQFELNPTTRAISAPHNFHAGQMFHRFGETRESSLLRRWSVDVSRTDGTSSGVTDPDDYTPGNALKWNSTAEEFELSTAANKEARIEYNHDTTEIFAIHDRETKAWYGVENQYIAKVTSTITAGSYDTSAQEFTLGSGTVTPLRQDSSSPSPKLIPIFEDGSEVSLTVYNTTTSSVTSPSPSVGIELVWIERNRYDGRWYLQKESTKGGAFCVDMISDSTISIASNGGSTLIDLKLDTTQTDFNADTDLVGLDILSLSSDLLTITHSEDCIMSYMVQVGWQAKPDPGDAGDTIYWEIRYSTTGNGAGAVSQATIFDNISGISGDATSAYLGYQWNMATVSGKFAAGSTVKFRTFSEHSGSGTPSVSTVMEGGFAITRHA